MNNKLYLRPLPAALMLILFLAASFVGSEGTLLCFGKDGHVAIEFVDDSTGPGFGFQHKGMEDDACGACTDVHLFSGPAFARNAPHYAQTVPLMSPVSPLLPSKEYCNKYVILPQHSHHKTLASLHSAVLLI